MRISAVLLLAVGAAACGPVQSTAVILDADVELDSARTAQAEIFDPYDYTAAEAYLWKARELQGYAEYEKAITFGAKALEMAKRARGKAMSARSKAEEGPSAPEGPAR